MPDHTYNFTLPDPSMVEDPFMKIYTILERTWMEAMLHVLSEAALYESDGATMESLVEVTDVLMDRACTAMEQWHAFARKYHDFLETGPGPRQGLCILCREAPPGEDLHELCDECLLKAISLTNQ